MTEDNLRNIIKQHIDEGTYPITGQFLIMLMKQAVNEAIDEFKKEILEEQPTCTTSEEAEWNNSIIDEDLLTEIAERLKVK